VATSDLIALAALGVSLLSALLVYRASRVATRVQARAVDATEDANQLQWVRELRTEANDAKAEVQTLRGQVGDLRRQLTVVTREAEQLVAELKLYRRTAWREGMTIDRFREFIGPPETPTAVNGRAL
jgi:uncharacterized coiled-coil DUF342 family protein